MSKRLLDLTDHMIYRELGHRVSGVLIALEGAMNLDLDDTVSTFDVEAGLTDHVVWGPHVLRLTTKMTAADEPVSIPSGMLAVGIVDEPTSSAGSTPSPCRGRPQGGSDGRARRRIRRPFVGRFLPKRAGLGLIGRIPGLLNNFARVVHEALPHLRRGRASRFAGRAGRGGAR
jgi:hypothetical protein